MISVTVVVRLSLRTLLLVAVVMALQVPTSAGRQVLTGDEVPVSVALRQAYEAMRGPVEGRERGEVQLKEVLYAYPSHKRAREVDLWRRYRFGGSFMPVIRHELRERAATRLIEEDSSSAGAHLVLGLLEMDLFREAHNRVQLPSRLAEGNRIDSWLGFVDVAIEKTGDQTLVSLFDSELLGARARLVRDDDVATSHADRAREYLTTALADPFWAAEAGRSLAELGIRTRDGELIARVAARLAAHGEFEAQAQEYWTLHYILRGQVDRALESHAAAVEAMDTNRRVQVEDLQVLAPPSQVAADSTRDNWLDRDPLWMTEGNERAAEHLARVVAVELLFGTPDDPGRALFSDPGQLVLRYGIPSETVQFSSDVDGYMLLNYPDQYYLFHDMAKAGKWIFFSSSAAALTGPRSVAPQWERDFALRAREAFELQPDIGRVPSLTRTDMDTAWYVFPDGEQLSGGGQMSVVAAWCAPEDFADLVVEMGMYAVADGSQRIRHLREWKASVRRNQQGATCHADTQHADVPVGMWRLSLEAVARDAYAVSRHRVAVSTMSSVVPARLIVDREPGAAPPAGFFERGDVWIQPLVPAKIRADEPVSVYAEVTGIPPATGLILIEAVLRKRRDETRRRWFRGGQQEAVSVRFKQDVTGARAAVRVALDVSNVEPGAYDLVVRVTGGDEESYATENRTTLIVLEDVDAR